MLRGKDKYETFEKCSIAIVVLGSLGLAAGIGLSALQTTGYPTIIAMLGSFVLFIGTILLIVSWLLADWKGTEQ
jgi:uncharacterized membrane protein HdeD (DUF308 family)